MSVQDSYVDRRSKVQTFGTAAESAIVRALAAKSNAVRRMGAGGRRQPTSGRTARSSFAA